METPWDNRYAQRTQRMGSSAIRELLKLTEKPNIISFAGGLPAPEVFPVEEFSEACVRVFRDYGTQALQYSAVWNHDFTGKYINYIRLTAGFGSPWKDTDKSWRPDSS